MQRLKKILKWKVITLNQLIGYYDLLKSHVKEFDRRFPVDLTEEEIYTELGDLGIATNKQGEELKQQYRAATLTHSEVFDKFPKYVEDIVLYWTGKESIIELGIDKTSLLGLFAAIVDAEQPQPKEIREFKFKDKTYRAAQDRKDFGLDETMGTAKLWQLAEGLTLQSSDINHYERIKHIISVFFWADDEEVKEQNAYDRRDLFNDLDVETGLGCYFFFDKYIEEINRKYSPLFEGGDGDPIAARAGVEQLSKYGYVKWCYRLSNA